MATDYCEIAQRFGASCQELGGLSPTAMGAFQALHHAACPAGADDLVQRELIALGMSIAIDCEVCIAVHTNAALQSGATEKDILRVIEVAIVMGGGPGLVTATHALDALKQFQAAS